MTHTVQDVMGNTYKERMGLEGPYVFMNGQVLYYDTQEDLYYDPRQDHYVDPAVMDALYAEMMKKMGISWE